MEQINSEKNNKPATNKKRKPNWEKCSLSIILAALLGWMIGWDLGSGIAHLNLF